MATIAERAALAADPTATVADLTTLATDRSPVVRAAVARNPATPPDLLHALVEDRNFQVLVAAVTENPSRNAITIALASPVRDARQLVAQRDDLTSADIEALLRDPAHQVREQLATWSKDPEVLARLARDAHPSVRSEAVLNQHLSKEDTEMLASDRIARVRAAVASSRRLDPATLTRLAADRSVNVRWNVLVFNPERLDLAALIAEDTDEIIAVHARGQLDDPREFMRWSGEIE